jgi:hypothetical protein
LRVGRQLGTRSELLLGAGKISASGQHDAEVVASLPELGVHLNGISQKGDRAIALPTLGRLNALYHQADRHRIGRRNRCGRIGLRSGRRATGAPES